MERILILITNNMTYLKTIYYILSLLISNREVSYTLPNVSDVDQIIYINEYTYLIVDDENIFELNVLRDSFEKIGQRKADEFVGYDNGGLIYCKIEHFLIYSENDFSTKLTVFDSNRNVVKELRYFETIRPIYIDDKYIYAVTALDFLEQHRYFINIQDGILNEREDYPKRVSRLVTFNTDIFGNISIKYKLQNIIKRVLSTLSY